MIEIIYFITYYTHTHTHTHTHTKTKAGKHLIDFFTVLCNAATLNSLVVFSYPPQFWHLDSYLSVIALVISKWRYL